MTELYETTIGQLLSQDVGRRIVVTQAGVGFDGTLVNLNVTRSEYTFKGRPKVTAALTVKVLELPAEGDFMGNDKVLAELKLSALPLDYKVQIELGWVPEAAPVATPEAQST